MAPLGRWIVPSFLIVVGLLLLLDAHLLYADSVNNYPALQGRVCPPGVGSNSTTCATLTPCQSECALAIGTGSLGASALAAGAVVTSVRWSRFSAGRRR